MEKITFLVGCFAESPPPPLLLLLLPVNPPLRLEMSPRARRRRCCCCVSPALICLGVLADIALDSEVGGFDDRRAMFSLLEGRRVFRNMVERERVFELRDREMERNLISLVGGRWSLLLW